MVFIPGVRKKLFKTCTNFTRDSLPKRKLIFSQIHKNEGMLLQYSGAALVRDADSKMGQVTAAMRGQIRNPSGNTHIGVTLGDGLGLL